MPGDPDANPLPPPAHPLRVLRYARWGGYSPRQWAVAIARTDWTADAELLKAGRRGTVWRAGLTPQKRTIDCVVKVEPCVGFVNAARAKLGLSRFSRQWAGAETLHRAGVATGRPKAMLLGGRGRETRIVLALDAVEGRTVLEHLARLAEEPDTRTERALAAAIGVNLAAMRRGGIRNRDHKPSNLVARLIDVIDPDPWYEIAVIDTMGIERPLRSGGDSLLVEPLASLIIEPAGVGLRPRRTTRMRVLRAVFDAVHGAKGPSDRRNRKRWRAWRARTWARVEGLVSGHGDPTPEDDPLAHGA